MTINAAKQLTRGQWLHNKTLKQNRGKDCFRVRVNGQPQTWKTRPDEVRVPVKWGYYNTGQLRQYDLAGWELEANCPNENQPCDLVS